MKTSDALATVKTHLSTCEADWKRDIYICHATDQAADIITWAKAKKIKAYIVELLDGCYSLDSWLALHHGNQVRLLQGRRGVAYRNKMQVTRHAWIDDMIAHFRSKGD